MTVQARQSRTNIIQGFKTVASPVIKQINKDEILPYLLLTPAAIILLVFIGIPLIYGISLAFTNKSLVSTTTSFVGLKNFIKLSQDRIFWQSLLQSILWVFYTVSGEILIGLGFALIVTQQFKGRGFVRAILLTPWTVPLVAIATVFLWLYDPLIGYIKYFFDIFGIKNILFLANPNIALLSVSIPVIWRSFPFVMLMFVAGLEAIDRDLYEVASIDGAGSLAKFRFITLPLLRPIALVVILLEIIWMLNVFDVIWVMTRGGPVNSTQNLATFTYWQSIMQFKIGYGTAAALIMLVILLVVSYFYWRLKRLQ
jgi:multiple sugar transport system permease protein